MPNNNIHTIQVNFEEPLVSGFLKSVSVHPDKNALWINKRYHTYEELWQMVYSIYHQIPTDEEYELIGIYCSNDVKTYAAILAVSLYGAAYVPLNSKYPEARNKNIIDQCNLRLVLTSDENIRWKEISGVKNIVIKDHSKQNYTEITSIDSGSLKKINQAIAYILFTSGSTGDPKGVPVSNSNVNHFFYFFKKNYDFNSEDRFLQVYELTFDVSVFSFFMPLYVGACCYVLPDEGIKFVKILQLLEQHKITVVSMVPTVLRYIKNYLNEIKLPYLRYSFFSGDALYHQLALAWKEAIPNAQIHNFYGPTETTIVCTRYIWEESISEIESVNGIVPLGKPFEGMETLIIDENEQPVKKGELCFAGTQVISHYLNNEKKQQFFNYKEKRYYKTGDVVSYNDIGNLIFYGRTDGQMKINGYRVEAGEIEFAIKKVIDSRAVIVFKGEKLTAFIETNRLDERYLKEQLQLLLPDYMIPHKFIEVDSFPLTINGKIDKNKLLNFQKQI